MLEGKVIQYNDEGGGFIRPLQGSSNIIFLKSGVAGQICKNDKVYFEMKGLTAINIKRIKEDNIAIEGIVTQYDEIKRSGTITQSNSNDKIYFIESGIKNKILLNDIVLFEKLEKIYAVNVKAVKIYEIKNIKGFVIDYYEDGSGYIRPAKSTTDIYFHYTDVIGQIHKNDKVYYDEQITFIAKNIQTFDSKRIVKYGIVTYYNEIKEGGIITMPNRSDIIFFFKTGLMSKIHLNDYVSFEEVEEKDAVNVRAINKYENSNGCEKGIVTYYDKEGDGFIKPSKGGKDIFFLKSEVFGQIFENSIVSYDEKIKFIATKIQVISQSVIEKNTIGNNNILPANFTNPQKIVSPASQNPSLTDILSDLNNLIGLDAVKHEIKSLVNFIQVQKKREQSGLKSSAISYHIVFTGNPGTGKTTVARIIAKIYKCLGIISGGHLIETDRSGLIAEYVGHTAIKVNKLIDSALNGILFIDEAYSIAGDNKDDYGKEAVATLIKRMEDDRDKLVIIMAGYTNEMKKFIDTNPGFKSRFNKNIEFTDYTPAELVAIFESQCNGHEYILSDTAKYKIVQLFEHAYSNKDKSFGNGRFVRNVFEKTLERQANRLSVSNDFSKENLSGIAEQDIFFN